MRIRLRIIVGHFPAGPGVARQVQQQGCGYFQDIKQTAPQRDAGHARPALPHADTDLGDLKPGAVQQQNHLRLGIIIRIPMGKCADHPAVGNPKSARAIGNRKIGGPVDDGAEDLNAQQPGE
jgi:hypothetical protein